MSITFRGLLAERCGDTSKEAASGDESLGFLKGFIRFLKGFIRFLKGFIRFLKGFIRFLKGFVFQIFGGFLGFLLLRLWVEAMRVLGSRGVFIH